MKKILDLNLVWVVAPLAFVVAACGVSTAVDDNETQVWSFSAFTSAGDTTSATADCLPGGACTAKSWTLLEEESFGCSHLVDFGVQFSGDQVSLLTFTKSLSSTCSSTSTVGNGTGTANAAYPSATEASGTVTLSTTSPIGPSSGTVNWVAQRLN
jgi:hypothetical protein